MISSSPGPGRRPGAASRHGRAADALIAGYLRELLADEDAPAASADAAVTDDTLAAAPPGRPLVTPPADAEQPL